MSLEKLKSRKISISLLTRTNTPQLIKQWLEGVDVDRKAYQIGSAVDMILLEPEKFDENYIITKEKPYYMMDTFISNLPKDLTIDSEHSLYEEAYKLSNYKRPLKTLIAEFWESQDLIEYYEAIQTGKTILSGKDAEVVNGCYLSVMGSPHSRLLQNSDFQCTIEFTHLDYNCKAILDIVHWVDENTIQPVDLKTTAGFIEDFPAKALEYNYYLQAAFYTKALKEKYPDKVILPFKFLVVSKKTYNVAVYNLDFDYEKFGFNGGYIQGIYYKGIDEMISNLTYFIESNQYDIPMDKYQTPLSIKLDVKCLE